MENWLESRGYANPPFSKGSFLGISRITESGAFNRLNDSVLIARVAVKYFYLPCHSGSGKAWRYRLPEDWRRSGSGGVRSRQRLAHRVGLNCALLQRKRNERELPLRFAMSMVYAKHYYMT